MVLEAWLDAAIGGLIGLLFGSFLNVVIYRLPKMMERQWAAELAQAEASNQGKELPEDTQPTFNLMTPRSRCPACGHVVQWHENIPVVSYLFLRGRCSSCKTRISPRYPLVELRQVRCSFSASTAGARLPQGWRGAAFRPLWWLWHSLTGTPHSCQMTLPCPCSGRDC